VIQDEVVEEEEEDEDDVSNLNHHHQQQQEQQHQEETVLPLSLAALPSDQHGLVEAVASGGGEEGAEERELEFVFDDEAAGAGSSTGGGDKGEEGEVLVLASHNGKWARRVLARRGNKLQMYIVRKVVDKRAYLKVKIALSTQPLTHTH